MIKYLLILLILASALPAKGSPNPLKPNLIGLKTGYGFQDGLKELHPYQVVFLQLFSQHMLVKRNYWTIQIVPQPQVNITRFIHDKMTYFEDQGYEFGLNMGFLFSRMVRQGDIYIFVLVGTGPHYISGAPKYQSPGLIFSDNFVTGMDAKLSEKMYLRISGGFRHISNAGLKRPNRGVNNWMISKGIYFKIQ
jgi:hypothetical protein